MGPRGRPERWNKVIHPTGYQLTCDTTGCVVAMVDTEYHRLSDRARTAGWALRRRLDGTIAKKGGRDYCPACVPAWWAGGATS